MSKLRQSIVRIVLAAVTGLATVTVLPQAAPAAPPAAPPPTLAQLIERERQAEAARDQQLFAAGPIDDFELNRMLIEDLRDFDEDAEVRAAAAQVLLTNDPEEFAAFLDEALSVYRGGRRRAAQGTCRAAQAAGPEMG